MSTPPPRLKTFAATLPSSVDGCETCGMTSLVAPMQALEHLCSEGQLANAAPLVAEVREEHARTKLFLEERLELIYTA